MSRVDRETRGQTVSAIGQVTDEARANREIQFSLNRAIHLRPSDTTPRAPLTLARRRGAAVPESPPSVQCRHRKRSAFLCSLSALGFCLFLMNSASQRLGG
jgi:hypothetical protein